nr:hypothetical protein [Sorangium cellulosum]
MQLGKAMGAHVTALSSGKPLDAVRSLGADVAYDYRRPVIEAMFPVAQVADVDRARNKAPWRQGRQDIIFFLAPLASWRLGVSNFCSFEAGSTRLPL